MPFDAAPQADIPAAADPNALYRERRETVARMLEVLPPEKFDLVHYQCGTTACALGWLAHWKHDGWKWGDCDVLPERDRQGPTLSAAEYFGLSYRDADACFSASYDRAERLYGKDVADVSAQEVADALRTLPFFGY